MKVLIIEDEQFSAHILQDILKDKFPDIEVLASLNSVVDSVAWFEQNDDPDLIFMDLQMPVMNGYDATTKILLGYKEESKNFVFNKKTPILNFSKGVL